MPHPDDRAADLCGQEPTPAMTRLVATLDRVYRDTPPSDLDAAMLRVLHERSSEPEGTHIARRRPRRSFWSRGPLVLVAAVLLGLVIVAGNAHAGGSLMDQVLSWFDSASQQSTGQKLGQEVNLSQTVCGFTMTIKRVYADANQIIVAYTIAGQPQRTFTGGFLSRQAALTDAQGNAFPSMSAGGSGRELGEEAWVATFDAAVVQGTPSALQLHLVFPSLTTIERLGDTAPVTSSCETYRQMTPDEVPQGWTVTNAREVTINGPFAFDFTVPFIAGHVADLQQSSDVGGTTVTLERVVVTPIETRLYVRGVTPGTGQAGPQANAQLSVGDQIVNSGVSIPPANGVAVYSFATPLYSTRGEATVVIHPRPDFALPGQPKISGGPWTFHFALP